MIHCTSCNKDVHPVQQMRDLATVQPGQALFANTCPECQASLENEVKSAGGLQTVTHALSKEGAAIPDAPVAPIVPLRAVPKPKRTEALEVTDVVALAEAELARIEDVLAGHDALKRKRGELRRMIKAAKSARPQLRAVAGETK